MTTSNQTFILDRMLITGPITIETPSCVVYDIVSSRGITVDKDQLDLVSYRARLIKTLESNPPIIVQLPVEKKDYSSIAMYVNPDPNIQWTKKTLHNALKSIINVSINRPPQINELSRISIGNPTPENDNIVPVSVIYKWCNTMDGRTNYSMTCEDLRRYCLLLMSDRNYLIESIMDLMLKDNRALSSAIMNTSSFPYDRSNMGRVTADEINNRIELHMRNNTVLTRQGSPRDKIDAVLMAAFQMKIDLSYSETPMQDYYSFMAGRPVKDERMRRILSMCPTAYSLTSRFNPIFPESVYNINTLKNIVTTEQYNISTNDFQSLYQELALIYYTDTFHTGVRHNIQFETPVEMAMIDEDDNVPIIFYGSIPNGIISLTLPELAGLITEAGDFVLGLRERIVLSKDNISRLKFLINKNKVPPRRRVVCPRAEAWERLGQCVARIETVLCNMEHRLNVFRRYYNDLSMIDKNKVQSTLKGLIDVACYMRGWNGVDPRPIETLPPCNTEQAEIRSNLVLAEYNSMCRSLGYPAAHTLDQPLIVYDGGSFKICTEVDRGLTIMDRINIVMEGKKTNNMASCIRLSSNVFLYSVATYMRAIGVTVPYDINRIRQAS